MAPQSCRPVVCTQRPHMDRSTKVAHRDSDGIPVTLLDYAPWDPLLSVAWLPGPFLRGASPDEKQFLMPILRDMCEGQTQEFSGGFRWVFGGCPGEVATGLLRTSTCKERSSPHQKCFSARTRGATRGGTTRMGRTTGVIRVLQQGKWASNKGAGSAVQGRKGRKLVGSNGTAKMVGGRRSAFWIVPLTR